MRKVSEQIARAFLNGHAKAVGNSSTDGKQLFLHGNLIARKDDYQDSRFETTLAGWPTRTTMERLNSLLYMAGSSYRYAITKGLPVIRDISDKTEKPIDNDSFMVHFDLVGIN